MKSTRTPQLLLPLVTEDLSGRLSSDAKAGATRLLKQMLLDVVRADPLPKEIDHDREDPIHPS